MGTIKNRSVTCFGEILWDLLPSGKQPGGAPMNVALHLNKLGVNAGIISKVGSDALGTEIVDYLHGNNIGTNYIQIDNFHPTGKVKVDINEDKNAKYEIVFPVAWDYIDLSDSLLQQVKTSEYFVFGSLAARNDVSRNSLFKLIMNANKKVFDVNLRAPHYTKELIEQLLFMADIVKLNEEEVEILKAWFGFTNDTLDVICNNLKDKFSIETLIVTLGNKGALIYHKENMFRNSGFKVTIQDTIGSGDSFLAAFLASYMEGKTIPECLELACATGAYVATCAGANPDYSQNDIEQFIKERKS